MQKSDLTTSWSSRLWEHIKPLLTFNDHKRPWGFIVVVVMAMGLPVFIGAWIGQFSSAILASMGGMVILYMQQTTLSHRMMTLAVCSFGFAVSFALGTLTSFNLYLSTSTLALTVFLVTIMCRYFSMPPPGTFFFILVACMSRTLPFDLTLVAERTGIFVFGCLGACLLAFIYSVLQHLLGNKITAKPAPQNHRMTAIVLESAVISLFIGGGYFIALLIKLDNPYWVPISTAAIMQGATFQAVWHRNVHRIVGTFIGMGLAWLIFSLSPNHWVLVALIILLSFMIESLITKNYGLAVIFITPLTVIFADFSVAAVDTENLMLARLLDIVIGSMIGYCGGWVIHHPRFFSRLEAWIKRSVRHQ